MTYPLGAPQSQLLVHQGGVDLILEGLYRNISEAMDINQSIDMQRQSAAATWTGSSGEAFQNAAIQIHKINERIIQRARYGAQKFRDVTDDFLVTDNEVARYFA